MRRHTAVSSYSYLSAQVPAWTVQRFASYARLTGADVEVISIPFANHVYNQLAANSVGNQLRRSVTLRCLRQQGQAEVR